MAKSTAAAMVKPSPLAPWRRSSTASTIRAMIVVTWTKHYAWTGERVEAALHCRAHPVILVPGHARRQLHQMAETEAQRQRGEHNNREANGPK